MEEKSFTVRFELEVTASSRREAKRFALDDLVELRQNGTLEGEIITGPQPFKVKTSGGPIEVSPTTDDPDHPGVMIVMPDGEEIKVDYSNAVNDFKVCVWAGNEEDPLHSLHIANHFVEEAEDAVELAELTMKRRHIRRAQEAIEAMPFGEARDDLQERLDVIEE